MKRDSIIALGIFFLGFLVSSEMFANPSNPKKAKKIVRYNGNKYICPISFSNGTGW